MNRTALAAALLPLLAAGAASAAEFDGRYAVAYTEATTRFEACVTTSAHAVCVTEEIALDIEDGAPTQASIEAVAQDLVDQLAAATDHELSPRAQARVAEAFEEMLAQVQPWLGSALACLPAALDLDQLDRRPEALLVGVTDAQGVVHNAAGEIDPERGAFTLGPWLSGEIDRDADYAGTLLSVHRFDHAQTVDGISLSLSGEATLAGDLAPIQ